MKLAINNNRRIFAIQKEFNSEYPNLSIEFYERSRKAGAASGTLVRSNNKNLSDCRTGNSIGFVTVEPEMTCPQLIGRFKADYGLSITVFRRNIAVGPNVSVAASNGTLEELNKPLTAKPATAKKKSLVKI